MGINLRLVEALAFALLIVISSNSCGVTAAEDTGNPALYLDRSSRSAADIVFVFDSSGSMGSHINEMKSISKNFAKSLNESGIDYRLGLVSFRDFPISCENGGKRVTCGDPDDFPYKVYGNPTSDLNEFYSWVNTLEADGGGDVREEAMLPAIRHALDDMEWREDADKLIILITDGYPHSEGDCCNVEGDTLSGTISTLISNEVKLYAVGPENESIQSMVRYTGGRFYNMGSSRSLDPILGDIFEGIGYSFQVELDASCRENDLVVDVILIGKGNQTIPYMEGETEAWMFIDSEGNRSRRDLEYDTSTEAYSTTVRRACGSVELTVFGRVGKWSSMETNRVECGPCSTEPIQDLSISGRIYEDQDDDGVLDSGEQGLEGWDVRLEMPDGRMRSTKTGETGFYAFEYLPSGIYRVRASPQEGYSTASPEGGVSVVELIDTPLDDIDFVFKFDEQEVSENKPPRIIDLIANPESPQPAGTAIMWIATAKDDENDPLEFKFQINGETERDWSSENTWMWNTSEFDVGSYNIEVSIRDGKHAGPSGLDDSISYSFEITSIFAAVDNTSSEESKIADESGLIIVLGNLYNRKISVVYSPDGSILASGAENGTISLWDVTEGHEIRKLFGHSDWVFGLAFSPDGQTLASGSYDSTVKIWDMQTGHEIRTLEGHSDMVRCVAFSPDGRTLASGSYDSTVKIWDMQTGQEIRTLADHSKTVNSVAFSPDGRTLASGSSDSTIKIWDVDTGQEIRTLDGYSSEIFSVAFSPDGQTLASGSGDSTIKIWNVDTGREIRTLVGHSDIVCSVAFSPDGQTFSTASYDSTIKIWDLETGQEIRTLDGYSSAMFSVAFSPDGRTLASGSRDSTIKLWDLASGCNIGTFKGHSDIVCCVAFSPDGKILASGSEDSTIKLWDLETGQRTMSLDGHSNRVRYVAFSPDGQTLASGSDDNTVRLWNIATGQEIRTLSGHSDMVSSVAFSPDGQTLASGSHDSTVKLWDVISGRKIRTISGDSLYVFSVAFSPDGWAVASCGFDETARLLDVETGSEIRTLAGHFDWVNSVAFSPDGETLVTGSDDDTVKLWKVDTGREIRTLSGHSDDVNSVAFSPDGRALASGSSDGTIRLWLVA